MAEPVVQMYVNRIHALVRNKRDQAGDSIYHDISEMGAFYCATAASLVQEIIGLMASATVTVTWTAGHFVLELQIPPAGPTLSAAQREHIDALVAAFQCLA